MVSSGNGPPVLVRIERSSNQAESVSRFLENGIPLFSTSTNKATDEQAEQNFLNRVCGQEVLNEERSRIEGTTGQSSALKALFGCGDELQPSATVAERSLMYEQTLKHDAEAQLMRSFKLGEEQDKKSDPFLANWPTWLSAQRSQQNAITQLQQLQKVLSAVNGSQSLDELHYPQNTPDSGSGRPLFQSFDAISSSTQCQEMENLSLALMRRLSGLAAIRQNDLAVARRSLTEASSEVAFFHDLVVNLLGEWNLYSQTSSNLSAIATSEEFDFKNSAEIWVEILSVPCSVWGIDREIKKGNAMMEKIRKARLEEEQNLDRGREGSSGNQATEMLTSYLEAAEGGRIIAPSGHWACLPVVSPFTSLFAVLNVRKKIMTDQMINASLNQEMGVDEVTKTKYQVMIEMKGDLGWWIQNGHTLKVQLRPTRLSPLSELDEVVTQCSLCQGNLERALTPVVPWKTKGRCPARVLSTAPPDFDFLYDENQSSEERDMVYRKVDTTLKKARLTALHRAIFILCQIQASVYLSKAPITQGEGDISQDRHLRSITAEQLKDLPVFDMLSETPIAGSMYDNNQADSSSSLPPWKYNRDPGSKRTDNKNTLADVGQKVFDDVILRNAFDLQRVSIPAESPLRAQGEHTERQRRYDMVFHSNPVLASWDSSSTKFVVPDTPLFVASPVGSSRPFGYKGHVELRIHFAPDDPTEVGEWSVPEDLCRSCKALWIRQWQALEILATARLVQAMTDRWVEGVGGVVNHWRSSEIDTPLITDEQVPEEPLDNDRSGRQLLEGYMTWLSKTLACGGPRLRNSPRDGSI